MNKRRIVILGAVLVAVFAAIMVYQHLERKSIRDCVLVWGRLAEFPDDTEDFEIETEGSMFTRAFRVSFKGRLEVIADWLSRSPGIADATTETISSGSTRYTIKPGEGAQRAEVEVDQKNQLVRIYVCWS